MSVDSLSVLCGKCKSPLQEDVHCQPDQRIPCPYCGSTARLFEVVIRDSLVFKSKLGLKGKHSGVSKPFIEEITGDDLHRKTNKWMNLVRVFDRENDLYKEIITDPITGEVIHQCIEPLSQHTGHGSDKYKNKPNKT